MVLTASTTESPSGVRGTSFRGGGNLVPPGISVPPELRSSARVYGYTGTPTDTLLTPLSRMNRGFPGAVRHPSDIRRDTLGDTLHAPPGGVDDDEGTPRGTSRGTSRGTPVRETPLPGCRGRHCVRGDSVTGVKAGYTQRPPLRRGFGGASEPLARPFEGATSV